MSRVGWFEIPVTDMDRAIKFYEFVFNIKITIAEMGPLTMGLFPSEEDQKGASGSLMKFDDFYKPDKIKGTLIYFSCEDVAQELARVKEAGGRVEVEKRQISPDVGYMGVFIDSEGNRIAVHSNP